MRTNFLQNKVRLAILASIVVIALLVPVTLVVSSSGHVNSSDGAAIVFIPQGSSVPPASFNVTNLLTGTYRYPFNFTIVIGVNNTIEWVNHDLVDHTVTSFITPSGAQTFDSGLIPPNGKFTITLTVPGVYKYTCMWHPWLAGEITVKS